MIKERDLVFLIDDHPESGLQAGEVGVVVHIYPSGGAFEVVFTSSVNETQVVTLRKERVRFAAAQLSNESEYEAALARVEAFFGLPEEPEPASPEGLEFSALICAVEAYESIHYPDISKAPHVTPLCEADMAKIAELVSPVTSTLRVNGESRCDNRG